MPGAAAGDHELTVHRLSAFSNDPGGGNPAGVVITQNALSADVMQSIAAEVGYSETAFAVPNDARGKHAFDVRYFAPAAEVTFCGHATIALGVMLGRIHGTRTYDLHTPAGLVPVAVEQREGQLQATLTSVTPQVQTAPAVLVDEVLNSFGWGAGDLNAEFSPALGYAGAWHLLLVAATRQRLAELTYDFQTLRDLMQTHNLTTVAVLFQTGAAAFAARNLFPPGGVIEDPATGAAAAAFGAYLRHEGHVAAPATVHIVQGEDMGRPSFLQVDIPAEGGVLVSGTAVALADPTD